MKVLGRQRVEMALMTERTMVLKKKKERKERWMGKYLCGIVQERKKREEWKVAKKTLTKEQGIVQTHLKLDEDQLQLQKNVLSHGIPREGKMRTKTAQTPALDLQKEDHWHLALEAEKTQIHQQ